MLCHSGEDHFSSWRGKLRSNCTYAISCQSPEIATLLLVVRNDGSGIHAEMTSSIVKYTEL